MSLKSFLCPCPWKTASTLPDSSSTFRTCSASFLPYTPEHFRLGPDSAGYRAGPYGKDLADVDLVGPGEAYERWKKTPEYQQWLEETGQLCAGVPRPEAGAFVEGED